MKDMTDSWGNPEVQSQIACELTRIDAEDILRSGLATNAPITVEQLFAAFRATPTGGRSAAFYAALNQILAAASPTRPDESPGT